MEMNRVELTSLSSVDNGQQLQLQLQLQLQCTPHFTSYHENHATRNEPRQPRVHDHANFPAERMMIVSRPTAQFKPYVRSDRVPRICWTPDLHRCFVHAVDSLGGEHRATPNKILRIMSVEGVTPNHIKSHLQLYRSMKHEERLQAEADTGAGANEINAREASPHESVDSSVTPPPCAWYFERHCRPSEFEVGSSSRVNDVCLELTLGLKPSKKYKYVP